MEVAVGGSGGSSVTPEDTAEDTPEDTAETNATGRAGSGVDLALVALVVVLLGAVVVGGVLAWQARDDRAAAVTEQQRYGEVLAAATAEAEAFINIRYDDAQASIDKVSEGATGEFREQYASSSGRVIEVLRQNQTVMEGEVLYAGVVDVDQDSATVITATSGTVANKQTDNEPVGRNFRLQLELAYEDGRWLTRDLQFVS